MNLSSLRPLSLLAVVAASAAACGPARTADQPAAYAYGSSGGQINARVIVSAGPATTTAAPVYEQQQPAPVYVQQQAPQVITVQQPAAPVYVQAAAPAAPVSLNTTVMGMLNWGDMQLPDSRLADDYNVTLQAGVPVTVLVRGNGIAANSSLDVYAYVLQNGVEIAHDDDSAGNLNSRIVFVPQQSGVYTIRVSSYGSSPRQGAYTLTTMLGAYPTAS